MRQCLGGFFCFFNACFIYCQVFVLSHKLSDALMIISHLFRLLYFDIAFTEVRSYLMNVESHVDTHAWTTLKGSKGSPSARQGHSLCSYEDSVYVFGGMAGKHLFNDLHSFSLGKGRYM
jgi:hypothetical protein